jgi:pimeloyl-ACP methyl ester carboxylesterase
MKRRATIAAVILGVVLFAYFRPLTFAHGAAHILLLRAGMHAKYVDVGGHRLRYFEGGNGPPLLLVHGLGSSSEDWALVLRDLTKAHRVYAPDLLGWGGSDKPRDGDYSIAAETELVRGFMDAVRLPRADVGGLSMGGWVALRLAALHPERVQRLVLIDSAGLDFATPLDESSFAPTTMDEARHMLSLQSEEFTKLPDFVVRDFLRRAIREGWVLRASMRSLLTRRDAMDGKLQRVTMPVLIVWGTADRLVPPSMASRLHAELPQSRVVMIPGCGHLAVIECRATAMPAIVQFLLPARGEKEL